MQMANTNLTNSLMVDWWHGFVTYSSIFNHRKRLVEFFWVIWIRSGRNFYRRILNGWIKGHGNYGNVFNGFNGTSSNWDLSTHLLSGKWYGSGQDWQLPLDPGNGFFVRWRGRLFNLNLGIAWQSRSVRLIINHNGIRIVKVVVLIHGDSEIAWVDNP